MPEATGAEPPFAELQRLTDRWQVGAIRAVRVPDSGTINTIRIVTTDAGAYVLRLYHRTDPQRVAREHRVVRCYGLMRAYDLWLYEEIYEKGNDRVRQFVRPGPFVPLERDWQPLREALGG